MVHSGRVGTIRGSTADAIKVIEAAYQTAIDDDAWIRGLLRALAPSLDQGSGLVGGCYDMSDLERPRVWAVNGCGASDHVLYELSQLATTSSPSVLRWCYQGKVFATTSDKIRLAGASVFPEPFAKRSGIVDVLDLNVQNSSGRGVMVGAPMRELRALGAGEIEHGEHLAAHIGAAFRLRSGISNPSEPAAGADAVLAVDGSVVHAQGEAQTQMARSALRAAAIAIERARGKRCCRDEKRALQAWQSLVQGGWAIFEHFESDGRRILIARRDPDLTSRKRLRARIRRVLARRAAGVSLKVIADELGISIATASRDAARGRAALGVNTPADLAHLVR